MPRHRITTSGDRRTTTAGDVRIPITVFADIRQDIINGLVSAQAEGTGWNAERSNIPVTAVVRTSDTVVTITLPAIAAYDITATETIAATIPNSALLGAVDVVATPSFTITAVVGSAGGPLTEGGALRHGALIRGGRLAA